MLWNHFFLMFIWFAFISRPFSSSPHQTGTRLLATEANVGINFKVQEVVHTKFAPFHFIRTIKCFTWTTLSDSFWKDTHVFKPVAQKHEQASSSLIPRIWEWPIEMHIVLHVQTNGPLYLLICKHFIHWCMNYSFNKWC